MLVQPTASISWFTSTGFPPAAVVFFCHIHIALVIMIVMMINSSMILTKGFGDGGRIDDGDYWHNNQGQAKSGEGGDARLNKAAVQL